jgi:hypothetical protein
MDEITKKWLDCGFLEGLDSLSDFHKFNLSIKYESVAVKILSSTEGSYTKYTESLIFPIIRRVFGGCPYGNKPFTGLNALQLLEEFNDYSKTDLCISVLSVNNSWSNIDVEAEMCRMYSDDYRHRHFLNRQIIEPLKYISPHRL